MTRRLLAALTLLLMLVIQSLGPCGAANALHGAPLMRRYTSLDYDAPPQHWSITTDDDGRVYVGNAAGVLRYDGQRLDLTRIPGGDPVRKVVIGADQRIYVGSHDTFGWLQPEPGGSLIYRELLTAVGLKGAARNVGTIWQVLATADGMYFRSERTLHFLGYDHQHFASWALGDDQRVMYVDGQALFARIEGVGFARFVDGRFVPEPGAGMFAKGRLLGLIPQQGWRLLVGDDGFYRADALGIRRMPGAAGTALRAETPYAVRSLDSGEFIVSTLDRSLLRFSRTGELRQRIHLGAFSALALGSDREGGVWAATEGELLRMPMPSPWSSIGVPEGLRGTVADFEWHQGALWLATSRGVARMRAAGDGSIVSTALDWVNLEAFALATTGHGLLIAHQEGLLVLEADASAPRTLLHSDTESILELLPSRFDEDVVYALGSNSLKVLRAVDRRWQLASEWPLRGARASGLVESAAGELWLADSRGGPQRWRLANDPLKQPRVAVFDGLGANRGLSAKHAVVSHVFDLDGRVHVVSGGRLLRLQSERFVPAVDAALPPVDRMDEVRIAHTSTGTYAYTRHQIWVRAPGQTQWQQQHPGSPLAAGFQRLRLNSDGTVRVSTWHGLLQFDPRQRDVPATLLRLRFDRISAQATNGGEPDLLDANADATRIRAGSRLEFRYSMVSMDSAPSYRWRLGGPDGRGQWSNWGPRDHTLGATTAGPHTLTIQARTASGRIAAPLEFRYQVVPPWHQQWWARLLGLAMLLIVGMQLVREVIRRRTQRLASMNFRLEARIDARTNELETLNRQLAQLATQDALTGIANRRAMEQGLHREWIRGEEYQLPLSVLMIDVDLFKHYNDTFGHLEGDKLLQLIADNLQSLHVPERELLARFGGEEFALLLPNTTLSAALLRAEAIRAAIEGQVREVTVSIGVAELVPSVDGEPNDLLRRADAALYRAKSAGRNRVEAALD